MMPRVKNVERWFMDYLPDWEKNLIGLALGAGLVFMMIALVGLISAFQAGHPFVH